MLWPRYSVLGMYEQHLAFDWIARRYVEAHVNFYILEHAHLSAARQHSLASALAGWRPGLSCVDERFAESAAEAGVECGSHLPRRNEAI